MWPDLSRQRIARLTAELVELEALAAQPNPPIWVRARINDTKRKLHWHLQYLRRREQTHPNVGTRSLNEFAAREGKRSSDAARDCPVHAVPL